MKKVLTCALLIAAIAVPAAFGQLRFEIGANAPLAVGYLSDTVPAEDSIYGLIEEAGIIPIPNLALFLQADLGLLKIGVGAKVQSIILYSLAYPAAQVEIALGNFSIDASLGGYYFGYYAIGGIYGLEEMDILLPDISVWLGLGKRNAFRIGGGAIGAIPTSMDISEVPYIAYAGLKIVLQ